MSEFNSNFQEGDTKRSKKLFDKKKWREQRYGCRAKLQNWENIKRKQAQRQFNKKYKNLHINFKSENGGAEHKGSKSYNSLKQAQSEYKAIQEMKKKNRMKQENIKKEKIEAIRIYKEKKAARFRKLSQKTRKGQPLMRGRIELLLEKIQRDVNKYS